MARLLNSGEIKLILEKHFGRKIWQFAIIGECDIIEGTNLRTYIVMVLHEECLPVIKELLYNVVNIEKIVYSGVPQAAKWK